jgi:selenophosphate synthase
LADPQTSGGLLVAVNPAAAEEVTNILRLQGLEQFTLPVGVFTKQQQTAVTIKG